MSKIVFSQQFEESFSKIKENKIKKRIWKKINQLENRHPIGKKLKRNPFWSIRVDRFRIIYEIKASDIRIADIIERKHNYRNI